MTVAQLIAWLQTQPQDARVDVGMNQEYQDCLTLDTCQLVGHNGVQYVLLGEEVYEEVYEEVFVNSDGVQVA